MLDRSRNVGITVPKSPPTTSKKTDYVGATEGYLCAFRRIYIGEHIYILICIVYRCLGPISRWHLVSLGCNYQNRALVTKPDCT